MYTPEIIYEDNHLIVVNKPAGMLTQGDSTRDESLFEWTKEYIKKKYNKPGEVYLGLLHRLDRPVSGLVCFARTSKAASRISEQFRSRSTKKIYHAIVEGKLQRQSAHLKNWLTVSKGQSSKSSTISVNRNSDAKQAELLYACLKENNNRTLIEIELLTGLKHQIRAQLSFIGNPIVGDFRYSKALYKPEKIDSGHAILLHAYQLTINHPTQKKEMTFIAPYPKHFPQL